MDGLVNNLSHQGAALMKIEKAIETLDDDLRALRGYLHKDYNDALDLGIEALKEIQRLTKAQHCHRPMLLPGETI